MTQQQFASLSSSIFSVVVAKRQRLVAATKEVERLLDRCQCDRGCGCSLRPAIVAAKQAESAAYHDLREAEAAHASYHKVRQS